MAAAPTAHFGAPIRQHPGEIQVQRRVKVDVLGKHFTGLRGAARPPPATAARRWSTESGISSSGTRTPEGVERCTH